MEYPNTFRTAYLQVIKNPEMYRMVKLMEYPETSRTAPILHRYLNILKSIGRVQVIKHHGIPIIL